jgi:predicted nuclease with TOPRIM domain
MPHINELNVEQTFKKQIAEDNKEKYNVYNRVIELSTENEQLKHKIKQFKESNNAMADELKSNFDVVRDKLK